MKIYKEQINLKSHGGTPTFINITPEVKAAIANSGIQSGIVTIISPHTTCSVFFEEFVHDYTEDGTEFLQIDLNTALSKIIPDQTVIPDQKELTPESPYMYPGPEHYADVASWPDAEAYLPGGDKTALLNCDAHMKATLIGNSATLEVEGGKLAVGSTGYIYFVDFDRTRERPRKCRVIIMGE